MLLLTRPLADSRRCAAALRRLHVDSLTAPLLTIVPVAADLPRAAALIVTSGNVAASLAAHPDLPLLRTLPTYCVGAATARRTTGLGFVRCHAGASDALALAGDILRQRRPADGPLLHLAGADLAADMAAALPGFVVARAVVYRAQAATALPAVAADALRRGRLCGVTLMSPRTARTWLDCVHQAGLAAAARALPHLCLSAAVAEACAPLGAPLRVADTPSGAAALELARRTVAPA